MPRFSARNAVIAVSFLLITALFLHLRDVLSDRTLTPAQHANGRPKLPPADRHAHKEHDATQAPAKDDKKTHAKDSKSAESLGKKRRTAVVVASQASENATWLEEYFPEWEKNIYHVDDPDAQLTVPKNKGRESMVYLTYIIDNYNNLPDNILFIHPGRYQWHNDDPDYDGLPMLRHFQLPYLASEGYVNIRCAWSLGCPAEIHPLAESGTHRKDVHAGGDYEKAFRELFPGKEVPAEVGVSCCAQFGVTGEKIRERPKADYVGFREWIVGTELGDSISGRVFEYSWHMIFGKPPVHCPTAKECYCKVFGLCDLECEEQGSCPGRYTLPPFSTLPTGWPYIGWHGEARERAAPET